MIFVKANLSFVALGLAVMIAISFLKLLFNRISTKVYQRLTIHYFGRNNSPLRPYGERLIMNRTTGDTFFVTSKMDKLAKKEIIQSATHPCETMADWLSANNMEPKPRPPQDFPDTIAKHRYQRRDREFGHRRERWDCPQQVFQCHSML